MSKEKPSIPKGTRDFGPLEVSRRESIFSVIRKVFRLHGYMPIETPAMEHLSTLMGKYGEEGDRLIFKILNSGDFPAAVHEADWSSRDPQRLSSRICEKALRYDLTVPFARYVVQHQNELTFPFKRFQIQAVWRADRPQKGRYREFYQCDADVIGSDSLVNEAELIQIIDEVFSILGIEVVIKMNNRKILAGLADHIGFPELLTDITTAIDKIEKIGLAHVRAELFSKGLTEGAIARLDPILTMHGTNKEKLDLLDSILSANPDGRNGISEIRELFELVDISPVSCQLDLDLTLARGLNYYTGAIIEVKAKDMAFGSICGGGRYDDLTGIFGLAGVSGVGISFGVDRIYDVLHELSGFPESTASFSSVMAVNLGKKEMAYCLPVLKLLREAGIGCEMYPEPVKMKKQMQYANRNKIAFVLIAGESEMERGLFTLRDMQTGKQTEAGKEEVVQIIRSHQLQPW